MPFSLRTEAFKDNPNRFALLNGPLVLCAAIEPRKPFAAIVADDSTLLADLRPVAGRANTFTGSAKVFRLPGEDGGQAVTLEPFYQAYHEHYVAYWDRFTPEQWAGKQEEFKQQLAAQRAVEARTVDFIQAGEEQSERDHHFQGERTDTREFNDRIWRFANTNGWFAWDMKVIPDQPLELKVEAGGRRSGNELALSVDGTELQASTSANSGAAPGPRIRLYQLPAELLKGKEKVTVKFQAPSDGRGGSVASVRVLKPAENK
jgi:hypothetical protein